MRLIDADALKEIISGNSYILHDSINSMNFGMFWEGIEQAIDESPTIDAVPRWIPYGERLPREKEVVLITNSEGNVRCGQFRGTSGKHWFWIGNTLEMVEAWMQLPEPYVAERKDDE